MAILRGVKALQRLCKRIEGTVVETARISDKSTPSIIRQAPPKADEEIVHALGKPKGFMSRRLHKFKSRPPKADGF